MWDQLDMLIQNRVDTNIELTTARQIKKFNSLCRAPPSSKTHTLDIDKVVHNLSNFPLDNATKSVLAKGFNFSVTPSKIPKEDIITAVESSISKLPLDKAEIIRQETCHILRKAVQPKKNISLEEFKALKALRLNKEIIVLPADKGNATVIMNTSDYTSKMREILLDPVYKVNKNDPTTYLEKTTKSKIMASKLDDSLKKMLIPREKSSRCPKMYGLPKIHKPNAPLRPIVSSCGSPTQILAKFLAQRFQPFVEKADSYVRNAEHFTSIISNITLNKGDILVSFDVVSLFTKIPITEALELIKSKLNVPADFITLTEHCLKNTYFQFEGQIYKQILGAPMGSPLSPVIANIYMMYFEIKALESAPLKPSLWRRYVDDTFIIWQHGIEELNNFLIHLNSIHEDIKFTMEIEENDCLPFLDILVKKKNNGSLGHTVYRKPTHTNRYLNANSNHNPSQLSSVINTLVTRSKRLADKDHIHEELDLLSNALQANGFSKYLIDKSINKRKKTNPETEEEPPLSIAILPYIKGSTDKISRILKNNKIKTIYKSENKISSLLRSPKDHIPHESHGIYKIPCGACEMVYIGRCNRKISCRIAEHKVDVTNRRLTSSIVQHVLNEGHKIDFNNTTTIASIYNETNRIYREAIEIHKHKNNMNTRNDSIRIPNTWKVLIDQNSPKTSFPKSPEVSPISSKPPNQVSTRKSPTPSTVKSPPTRVLRSRHKI